MLHRRTSSGTVAESTASFGREGPTDDQLAGTFTTGPVYALAVFDIDVGLTGRFEL